MRENIPSTTVHRLSCGCCTVGEGTVYRPHCTTAYQALPGSCPRQMQPTFLYALQFSSCANQTGTTVHRVSCGCGCHYCCCCCCKLLPPAALSHAAYLRAAPAATAIFVNKIFRSSRRKRKKILTSVFRNLMCVFCFRAWQTLCETSRPVVGQPAAQMQNGNRQTERQGERGRSTNMTCVMKS